MFLVPLLSCGSRCEAANRFTMYINNLLQLIFFSFLLIFLRFLLSFIIHFYPFVFVPFVDFSFPNKDDTNSMKATLITRRQRERIPLTVTTSLVAGERVATATAADVGALRVLTHLSAQLPGAGALVIVWRNVSGENVSSADWTM